MNSIEDFKKESFVEVDGDKISFKLKDIDLDSAFDKENMDYGDKMKWVKVKNLKEDDKLPIFSDVLFKSVFGNTNRKKYLCKFLSYYFKDVTIEELEKSIVFLKNEQDKTNVNEKARRVDLLTQMGNLKVNIEINNCGTKEMMERNMEYICRTYGEQNKSGESEKHDFVIAFNINNFTSRDGRDFNIWAFRDAEGKLMFDKIIIIQIYLPTLEKKYEEVYNNNVEKLSERERFLLMTATSNRKESDKFCVEGDKIMKDYQEEVSKVSHDKAVLDKYSKEWEFEQMSLERELIGKKKGLEQGIEQGVSQNRRGVAEKMLRKNEPIDKIIEYSGLSEEEILEIKKDLKI